MPDPTRTCPVCTLVPPSIPAPAEISFTSRGQHVCVEFGVSNGLADLTVFVAPADTDAAPGMGVLHFAPAPDQARAIGRMLLALADAAERGAWAPGSPPSCSGEAP